MWWPLHHLQTVDMKTGPWHPLAEPWVMGLSAGIRKPRQLGLRHITHREKEGIGSRAQVNGGGSGLWVCGLSPEFSRDLLFFP